jgi:superfamily I DNA/RNA helicase
MSNINWSVYQSRCFEWIERAIIENNKEMLCLVIEAVAGSGKTTVLREMIHRILTMVAKNKNQVKDLSILTAAFGKANAADLRKAIDSIGRDSGKWSYINELARKVHTKTLHGLSCGALIRGLNKRISRNGGRDKGLIIGNTDSGFNWKIQHLVMGSKKRGVSPVVFEIEDFDPSKYAIDLISLVGKIKAHGYVPTYAASESKEASKIKWYVDTINERTVHELVEMYTIERFYDVPVSVVTHWANAIVKASIKQSKTEIIDFDDMLYIPAILNLPFDKYDVVMIDEAQDISHVQRRIIHKLRKNGTILIAVGDSAQAIYMFRGAASNSMDLFRAEFNAQDADLPICYRCALSVEPLVTEHVPKFRVHEGNNYGTVLTLDTVNVPAMVPLASKTLVLCRNNAPLLKTAYNLLANNVPISMMGVDLAVGLVGLIDAVTKGVIKDTATFRGMLDNYIQQKKTKAAENGYKAKANFSKLDDETESLTIVLDNAIIDGRAVRTTDELKQAIAYLMRNKDGVKLSSIHRAKGFEADSVYIIERETANDDTFIPSKYAVTDEQLRQERNLYYVAVTRSKKRLYFVSVDAFASG